MNTKPALLPIVAALAVAILCLVVVLKCRSQEISVTRQLRQVERVQRQVARTAAQVSTARLGVCWSSTTDSSIFGVPNISLESPVLSGGVYRCPSGMTFVSVVPVTGR